MKLEIIKNQTIEENLIEKIDEIKEELTFIDEVLDKFSNTKENFIELDEGGIVSENDLHTHQFSKFHKAYLNQQLKLNENLLRREKFKVLSIEKTQLNLAKNNHLKLV